MVALTYFCRRAIIGSSTSIWRMAALLTMLNVGWHEGNAQTVTISPDDTLQVGTDGMLETIRGTDATAGGEAGGTAVFGGENSTLEVGSLGTILGGTGGTWWPDGDRQGGDGGIAVHFADGSSLTNRGYIVGGTGGIASLSLAPAGDGGIGVFYSGGGSLTNFGFISGGSADLIGGGGDGVRFVGVAIVTNHGAISAGQSIIGHAGSGLVLEAGGMVTNTNSGVIQGGNGYTNSIYGNRQSGGAGVIIHGDGTVINQNIILGGDGEGIPGNINVLGGSGVHILGDGNVQNSGTIIGGQSNGLGIGSEIKFSGGSGIYIGGEGIVFNSSTGLIAGGNGRGTDPYEFPVFGVPLELNGDGGIGVEMVGGGTLTNLGIIQGGQGANDLSAGAGGKAVVLGSGSEVINYGALLGGNGGIGFPPTAPFPIITPLKGDGGTAVEIESGSVSNLGTDSKIVGGSAGDEFYTGGYGVIIKTEGSVINEGFIQGGNGGSGGIRFGETTSPLGGTAVLIGADGNVNNSGQIIGGTEGAGVKIGGVGEVINQSGSVIIGGNGRVSSIQFDSLIHGYGGLGVELVCGGTVINDGDIIGGNGASDYNTGGDGIRLSGSGEVTNRGTVIAGAGGNGDLAGAGGQGVVMHGGSLENSGIILAGSGGTGTYLGGSGGSAVHFTAEGSIVNTGQLMAGIAGQTIITQDIPYAANGGHGVQFDAGGSVINSGTITGTVGVPAAPPSNDDELIDIYPTGKECTMGHC